ncbi:MAG TPA: ABC transporter substrate-binding protein [Geminicoccaceae bacterium]|nr:ABC transporter substrate-binding protein [Geminicoccaceae bacterium]
MARAVGRWRRRVLLALAVGVVVLAPLAAPRAILAADPSAEQVVQALAGEIWTTLRTNGADPKVRVDKLTALLEARADVGLISRLALGRHWKALPEAQRQDYEQLFRDVVIRSMARRLDGYAPDAQGALEERFKILGSAAAGKDDTLVRSKVFPADGPPVALDWRLRAGDAGPVIIDLIVEGASLLVSQRSEFAAVIEREDLDGLLAQLRARAGSTSS